MSHYFEKNFWRIVDSRHEQDWKGILEQSKSKVMLLLLGKTVMEKNSHPKNERASWVSNWPLVSTWGHHVLLASSLLPLFLTLSPECFFFRVSFPPSLRLRGAGKSPRHGSIPRQAPRLEIEAARQAAPGHTAPPPAQTWGHRAGLSLATQDPSSPRILIVPRVDAPGL